MNSQPQPTHHLAQYVYPSKNVQWYDIYCQDILEECELYKKWIAELGFVYNLTQNKSLKLELLFKMKPIYKNISRLEEIISTF